MQHVWVNHDHDLLDVTLHQDGHVGHATQADARDKTQQVATKAHGSQAPPSPHDTSDETIHTTANHPWLTTDRGWVTAGDLHTGEHVVELDGRTATITALHVRPGAATYYNLTVSQLHTYAVGSHQFVVHNTGSPCIGDKLPTWKKGDSTRGILDVGGKETNLVSGWPGKKLQPGTPAANLMINNSRHVEAQAAAIMREEGIGKADLWLNNTPCAGSLGCGNMLPHMLPEGAELNVFLKGSNGWEMTPYVGLPDSLYPGP